MEKLPDALTAWCGIVGDRHVEVQRHKIALAERATFLCERRIAAIISPSTTAEVQQCLKIAAEHRIPLYAISRGRNWGLGSSLPASDNCVLVDLGWMNLIKTS